MDLFTQSRSGPGGSTAGEEVAEYGLARGVTRRSNPIARSPGAGVGCPPCSGRKPPRSGSSSLRIPLLLFVGPRVLELDDEGAAVGVPLGWRTRNHVGSMYVGVMAAAADLASGMNAFSLIRSRYRRVVPVFKFANMEFLKRADGYTVFRTREGRRIAEAMEETVRTGQRVTLPVEVVATVPEPLRGRAGGAVHHGTVGEGAEGVARASAAKGRRSP